MRPEDLRKEIESHSSVLTNQRIFVIKDMVWKKGLQVMSNRPNGIETLGFFSAVLEYYIEASVVLTNEEEIVKLIEPGNKIAARMRVYGKPSPQEIENLLQISLRAQYVINKSLQKLRYFFRTAKQDPKGIDAALRIFGENIWEDERKTKAVPGKA